MNQFKNKSRFGWFIKLYNTDDPFILENCGQEVLFYLKYLKYTATLFFIMSICNIPVIFVYISSSYANS